jgi:hypothetical protein
MARVAVAPTLSDDELRCRGQAKIDADDDDGSMLRRQRARANLGEQVCKATLYGRARRARLKAMRESGSV